MAGDEPATKIVEFRPGDVVIQEGTLAEELYVLMSGRLEVTSKGVKIAEISARGSFVGEIAALLRCRRIATVTAVTPAKVMSIENVTQHFEENPSSALGIAQTLASRIMDMNDRIVKFRAELGKWVEVGKDALLADDLDPFRSMLDEMERLLLEGRSSG